MFSLCSIYFGLLCSNFVFGKCSIIFLNKSVDVTRWFKWNAEKLDITAAYAVIVAQVFVGQQSQAWLTFALSQLFPSIATAKLLRPVFRYIVSTFNQHQTI